MHVYIAYRDLKDHFIQNSMCGGTPVNNDYRFTAVNGGIYFLLTRDDMNYAVPMLQARSSAPNAEAR